MADSEKKKEKSIDLIEASRSGGLTKLIDDYIRKCKKKKEGNDEEKKAKFPNVAGFCRFCGVGQGELERLSRECPDEYDALCSVFEDEALNSSVAVTLIGAYMKKRLGYGEDKRIEPSVSETDENPTVVFMHDIMKDGE